MSAGAGGYLDQASTLFQAPVATFLKQRLTKGTDDKHYHSLENWSGSAVSQSRFNEVFLTQRVTLLRTLQRMVNNHSTAEDLLQETYLRVTRALSERTVEHLEPFVFQTARNLALDHLRARRIQARTVVDDVPMEVIEGVASPLSTPEDAHQAAQLLERLSVSLSQLSARQQRIFILSRLHGCSYQEIAEELAVSLSTVQKELKLIMAICIGVADRINQP